MGYKRCCVFVLVGVILVTLLHHFTVGKGQWSRPSGFAWENQESPNPRLLLLENITVTDGPKNAQVNTNNHSNKTTTSVPTWVKTIHGKISE